MEQKVYSQIASRSFGGKVAVFFAGADPLNSTLVGLLSWLGVHQHEYVPVDVEQCADLAPHLCSAQNLELLPILCIDGQVKATRSLLQALLDSGQMAQVLEQATATPELAVSEQALAVWRTALRSPADVLRLSISERLEHSLCVDTEQASDIRLVVGDILVALDRPSAARANGIAIDWVEAGDRLGFRISNPNQPTQPKEVTCEQLTRMLEGPVAPLLIDVRTDKEFQDSRIPKFHLLNADLIDTLPMLNRQTPLVFCCDTGRRSRRAALRYVNLGFCDVSTLAGGINAWKLHLAKSPSIG